MKDKKIVHALLFGAACAIEYMKDEEKTEDAINFSPDRILIRKQEKQSLITIESNGMITQEFYDNDVFNKILDLIHENKK